MLDWWTECNLPTRVALTASVVSERGAFEGRARQLALVLGLVVVPL